MPAVRGHAGILLHLDLSFALPLVPLRMCFQGSLPASDSVCDNAYRAVVHTRGIRAVPRRVSRFPCMHAYARFHLFRHLLGLLPFARASLLLYYPCFQVKVGRGFRNPVALGGCVCVALVVRLPRSLRMSPACCPCPHCTSGLLQAFPTWKRSSPTSLP